MPDIELISIDANLLTFVKSPSFLYAENPEGENYDAFKPNAQTAIVLTMDLIQRYDFTHPGHNKSVYQHCLDFGLAVFGAAFKAGHPAWENFSYVTYNGDTFRMLAQPVMVRYEDKAQLLIGSQSKEAGREYVAVPLIVENKDGVKHFTLKDSQIPKLVTTSIEIKNKDKGKTRLMQLVFSARSVAYQIKVRTDADYFKLLDTWESRDLEAFTQALSTLYGASANFSNMFAQLFIGKTFPANGLIIPVTSAKIVDVKMTKGGSEQIFQKIVFGVNLSTFAPLPVKAYCDGEESASIPLNQVTSISCYASHEAASEVLMGNAPKPGETWYLFVKGAGANPNEKPIHTLYTSFIPSAMQKRIAAMLESQSTDAVKALGGIPKSAAIDSNKPTVKDEVLEEDDLDYSDRPL